MHQSMATSPHTSTATSSTTASAASTAGSTKPMAGALDIAFRAGEAYEVAVRGHSLVVDQPAAMGGDDRAPTPTELFVAALAACVAFYAGRYLTRHGYDRDGLGVSVTYDLATDRPARVSRIAMTLRVPASIPEQRWPALRAVASHCTVHNSLTNPPEVAIDLTSGS